MKKRRFLALLLALCILALPVLTACDGLGDIEDELDNLLGSGKDEGSADSQKPVDSSATTESTPSGQDKPVPPNPVGPKPEDSQVTDSSDTDGKDDEDNKKEDSNNNGMPDKNEEIDIDEASGLQFTLSPNKKYYSVSAVKPLRRTHITIPSEYKGIPVTTIDKNAFSGCTSLESISLPDGLTHISAFAFFKCSGLKTIVIPSSVAVVGSYVFDGCESLNIYCEADSQPHKWDKKWNPDNLPVTWGFSCEHEWEDATCTEPSICSVCGAVDGEPLGHDIVDGACTRCDYEEERDETDNSTSDSTVDSDDKTDNSDDRTDNSDDKTDDSDDKTDSSDDKTDDGDDDNTNVDDGNGDDNGNDDRFTVIDGNNIADKATITLSDEWWASNPEYLVDGDFSTATLSGIHMRNPSFTFTWNESYHFTTLRFIVNGQGSAPAAGLEYSEITANSFSFDVVLYDGNGDVVYEAKGLSSNDIEECILDVDCEATQMVFTVYGNYTFYPIFEVETYTTDEFVVCAHDWLDATCVSLETCVLCGETRGEYKEHTIDEYVETIAPTCTEQGYDVYVCSGCYEVKEHRNFVAALGHSYDEDGICEICGASQFLIGLDDIESITASHDSDAASNLEKLFDGEKMSVGMWSNDYSKEYHPSYTGDYLTIVLKNEIELERIVLWTCGNWTTATLTFLDKDGNETGKGNVIYMSDDPSSPVMSTPEEVLFDTPIKVKTITLTAVQLKYEGANYSGQKTSEIEIFYCSFEECAHRWVNATCTMPMTCSVCGETDGEALGHFWELATCTEPMTCEVCGITTGDELLHNYEIHMTVDPTCTTDGYYIYSCSRCGYETTSPPISSPLGHDYDYNTSEIYAPTCTEDGFSVVNCTRCSEPYYFDITKALGHTFVDGACHCGVYDYVSVTYCQFNGTVWETASPNENGSYTLLTDKKSSDGTITLSDGTVVDREFFGWFDRDGNLYAPGETVVFTKDTCLYEAYGITVDNADDLKKVCQNSGSQTYIKLGADITIADTLGASIWCIAIIDLNGHTLTSTARNNAFNITRGSLALVGEGKFVHEPSFASTNVTAASVFFRAHGYGDAQYPQLFWIGKDVEFTTPRTALYVQTVVIEKTPNIYVAGKVNANSLAYITPVTTNALCEIASSATLILEEAFIEYAPEVMSEALMSLILDGEIIVARGEGVIITDTLKYFADITVKGGKFGVCEADRDNIASFLSPDKSYAFSYTDKVIDEEIVSLCEIIIIPNECDHIWVSGSWENIEASSSSVGLDVRTCSLCDMRYEEVYLEKVEITLSNGQVLNLDVDEIFNTLKIGTGRNATIYITGIKTDSAYLSNSIAGVRLPYGITVVNNRLFYQWSYLKTVSIPSSVTAIGNEAFYYCSRLTSVTIPSSVTSIGNSAFRDCKSLTSITIPSGVTIIGNYTFYNCTSLTSITIPSGVTSIGTSAFNGCKGLTSITIPSSVTSIGNYAFQSCTGLTSITIPSSVTSIGNYAFQSCTGLTSINVDTANTTYKSIDGNLYTNDGKTLILYASSKTDTSFAIPSGVTTIGSSAFQNCRSLTSVTIPSSVTSIGSSAFQNCSGLTSVTIPSSVTSIGNSAFSGCTGLTIYCEAESQPSGWSSSWNYSSCPVVWGHKQ